MENWLFWKRDWFVGLLVSLFFLGISGSDLIHGLEWKAYDLGVRHTSRIPSDKIAMIAIDDQSIANLGRWPWSREIHARMIAILAAAHPKLIGYTVFFFEPQVDPGLTYINKINELVTHSSLRQSPDAPELDRLLQDAVQNLNNDQKLSNSIASANDVVLGSYFDLSDTQGNSDKNLPSFFSSNAVTDVEPAKSVDANPLASTDVLYPIAMLGEKALGIGHLNSVADVDGVVRTEPLVVKFADHYYPSMALTLAAKSLNLDNKDVQIDLGSGVKLGNRFIATDESMLMRSMFYSDRDAHSAFQVDSFYDVYSGKISPDKYLDKIVLIGASAAGVGTLQVTPNSPAMAPVVILANALSSILNGDYFVTPAWASIAEMTIFCAIALYLIFLLPKLGAAVSALVTGALLLILLGVDFELMTKQLMWLQLMLPATLLLVGHILLTTKRYLLTEKRKQISESESAESNRMLGLTLQGQGQLDMAFDKFRKIPLDDSLIEVLYNLGLDFERKRQFNKAESVFQYMSAYKSGFRDLALRIKQAHDMSTSLLLGGGTLRSFPGALVSPEASGISKPMLGRYELEKEIGKGAMGSVYLGKDLKIGRTVAIKTVALNLEFEADELEDVKERFFREAETAGRLNHPNIVAIYDVGEEHDLAYIAMEYLKGEDLIPHTAPENLLPLKKVLSIIARVADALDYAHRHNVVHRDIKPANIMYDEAADLPKVTDFGIARITDASKTKTGVVLGTPSYMSPEQLAGKKIHGASDLFSLGVSLYQLACGKLPFEGDSMAELMYRIASQLPKDILSINPNFPPCFVEIIDKLLQKNIEDRYETGAQLAKALRDCAANIQD